MNADDNKGSTGVNRTLAGAILGANCSTGMAVAAGIVGVGFAPVVVITLIGAIIGAALFSEKGKDNERQ